MCRSRVPWSRAIVGGCVAVAACGGEPPAGVFSMRDSAGIRLVESTAPEWTEGEGWRLSADPVLKIGAVDGAEGQQLFRVVAARRRSDGRILVANSGTREIRLYDERGDLVWSAGREGEGPGEFQVMTALELLAGDSVGVYDTRQVRFSVFDRDGTFARATTLTRVSGVGHVLAGRALDGSFLVSLGGFPEDIMAMPTGRVRYRNPVMRYPPDGASPDTVGELPGAEQFFWVNEIGVATPPTPFAWNRLQAVRGNELVIAYTERPEVLVFDLAGELRQVFRRDMAIPPITRKDVDDYREDQRRRLRESGITNPTSIERSTRLTELMTFPPSYPVLDALAVDGDGQVWVRHARLEDVTGPWEWTVFGADGRWRGSVVTPERLRVLEVGADHVLGVTTDDLGVEYVEMYALEKGG